MLDNAVRFAKARIEVSEGEEIVPEFLAILNEYVGARYPAGE